MNRKYFLINCIIMFGMVTFSKANAQSSNDKESARIFVQKFYDQYNKLYSDDNFEHKYHEDVLSYTFKKSPGYFDKHLLDEYTVYDNAMPKQANEIVGLDFDPIMAAQDSGFDYYVGNVNQKAQNFFADIHCEQKGKGKASALKETISVVAEITKENGQWKFVNFYYPPPEGNGTNLLGLFKSFEKDAKEYMATHKSKSKN